MLDHPLNLNHPKWRHMRADGLFAADPFWRSDFEASGKVLNPGPTVCGRRVTKVSDRIAKEALLTQRTRFLIGKGEPEEAKLDAVFQSYSGTR